MVRGTRPLSTGNRALRRQGREGAEGRAGRGPGRASLSCTWTAGGIAIAGSPRCRRGPRDLPAARSTRLAERWYRHGAARRDAGSLRRVVDQAFCSAWGDDALELLGDLAFQDGRFGEAALGLRPSRRRTGRRSRSSLVHPDPSVDLARVAAKKWLCRAASDSPPSRVDLEEFARRYPGADGQPGRPHRQLRDDPRRGDRRRSAGDPGPARRPLADVRRLAATDAGRPRADRRRPDPVAGRSREGRPPPRRIADASVRRHAAPVAAGSLLAFHPIVLGDQVLVCDGSKVLAYNLGDRPSGSGRGRAASGDPGLAARSGRRLRDPRRLQALRRDPAIHADRGGPPDLRPDGDEQHRSIRGGADGVHVAEPGTSSIVALDWNTQGKLLWEVRSTDLELPHRPGAAGRRRVNFEGTPVADVAERLRGGDGPRPADDGLRRLLRRRHRRQAMDPLPGHGHARAPTGSTGGFGMPMNGGRRRATIATGC